MHTQDDGSFNNEGGDQGVLHETVLPWSYADASNPLWNNTPQLNKAGAQPSTTSSLWKQNGGV